MEDLPVKAIVIGVSVFVTMAVLSAVMLYYNTARTVADTISARVDIADTYDAIMNDETFEDTLTGVEVRSLITKYAGKENVVINILSISGQDVEEENMYNNVNNNSFWYKNVNNRYTADAKLISEAMLDLINPVWKCTAEKVENGDRVTINIHLDVDINSEE